MYPHQLKPTTAPLGQDCWVFPPMLNILPTHSGPCAGQFRPIAPSPARTQCCTVGKILTILPGSGRAQAPPPHGDSALRKGQHLPDTHDESSFGLSAFTHWILNNPWKDTIIINFSVLQMRVQRPRAVKPLCLQAQLDLETQMLSPGHCLSALLSLVLAYTGSLDSLRWYSK